MATLTLRLYRPCRVIPRICRGIRPSRAVVWIQIIKHIAQVAGERARSTKIARGNCAAKCYAGKAGAAVKSWIAYARYAGGYCYARKSAAAPERVIIDFVAAGYSDCFQRRRNIIILTGGRCRAEYITEKDTCTWIICGASAHKGYADARNSAAILKRAKVYARYAVRYD